MKYRRQNADRLRQRSRKTGMLFVDPEFPAVRSSLTAETNNIRHLEIVWQRPSDLVSNPCFVAANGPAACRQGRLGNCWFVAACACLSLHKGVFQKVVICTPPLNSWDAYCGVFEFRFWRFGTWVHVIVDDLPTVNGELLYCSSYNSDEFWCSLLEKAYAKLLGSYEALEGGELADALIDFTGGLTECLEFNQTGTDLRLCVTPDLPPSLNVPLDESKLAVSLSCCGVSRQSATLLHPVPVWKNKTLCEYIYKLLLRNQLTKTLIASAISTDDPDGCERETELGLIVGHAYAVTRLCAVPTKRSADSGSSNDDSLVRLVRLMNPWGHGTWKGAFSEGSSDWDLVDHSFCHSLCTNDSAENGEFWMRFEDFLRQFNYVVLCYTPMGNGSLSGDSKAWFQFIPPIRMAPPDVVCHARDGRLVVVPSEYGHSLDSDRPSPLRLRELWTDFTIHSCWTNEMSGGCLNCDDTFVNNPQFALDVPRRPSTSLVIYLFQKTERSPERLASTTGLYHIGMSVFRVEANRTVPIRSLNEPVHLVINSVYRNSRVVWLRLNRLPYGRYFVIPTTFYPNCLAEFMVRLVGSPPLLFFEVERTAPCLASPPIHRSKSVLLRRSYGKKIKDSGGCFRHWITTRQAVSPLKEDMSDFFGRVLLPPPSENLRLTILQSVIWPPSTSFLARVLERQFERIDERSLPPYYAHVSVNDQQASTGLYNLQLLKEGGGPGSTGLIQFRESFLFPKNNKTGLSFRFQLRIHHPVFDEVHSEYTGILDSSPGSDKSQPIIRHVPLFGRLGPNKSHRQTTNYREREHQICRIVSDPVSSSTVDSVCLPAVTKRQRAQNYRAAFQQSELLLLDAGCSKLLPLTSQTQFYLFVFSDFDHIVYQLFLDRHMVTTHKRGHYPYIGHNLSQNPLKMTSLLDLVQSLESGLVDTKTASQKDSLRTLVNGLQAIPIDYVQDKEVQCLVEFLVSRLALADPDIICTILDGFLWLARAVRTNRTRLLCSTQATHICQDGLFGQLIIQSLTKAPRLRVFRLLQLLLHGPHLSGLKTMGRSFLVSYVQAVDGEKDPECLTIIFDMHLVVIAQFELDEMQEDFFETMAAYFPINFTPPPGETAPNISRASLSEGLHRCLFASRTFSAPYLLPLLCEKADSDWPQAQLDSLSLLADCLHGCLGSTDMPGELRGQSIALHHLTSYLILIAHVLEKMANKSISHKLDKLTRSCLTGLIHAYSSQTRDIHLLKNFVDMLLKTFGIVLDEAERNAAVGSISSPPKLPTDQLRNYLLEAVNYSQPDPLLCGLLMDHLLRFTCSPLIHWSSTGTDRIEDIANTLGPWHPFFALACRLLDTCADSAQTSGQLSMFGRQIYQGTLHLLTTFHAALIADASESELVESKVSYELVITIFGLSTRLSRYDSAQDITTAAEINHLIELFGLVVRRLDHRYPQMLPASNLDTMREELESIVSNLYQSASSPTLDLLNSILFGQIEANFNQPSPGSCLALSLLQRAALRNPLVMARLFQFLLDKTTSTGQDHRELASSAVSSLISVLHFFAQTAAKSPVESCPPTMIRHLCDLLLGRLDVICQLMSEQPVPSQCMVENLGTTFRIITGLSEDSQQAKLIEFFNTQSVLAHEPLICVLFCSVIIALRGSVVETMGPSDIMLKLFQLATHTTPSARLENSIFEYITATVAQAYASVLNKCTEPLDSDINSHVVTTFDRLWNDCPSLDGLERFACHWLVACLQSLLAHPGPSRRVVFDKLSSVFLRSPEKAHPNKNFSLLETRICEFLEVLPTICSIGPPGDATSDVCHWEGTGSFVQKTFYLVTLPLVEQINAFSGALVISSSTEQQNSVERLRDAYLTAFLRLCLPLPTDLLEPHLKELTHYVLLAITSSRSLHTQAAGLRLFCSIVDCVKDDSKRLTSRFSAGDMDDVFACLPRLLESTTGRTTDKMETGYYAVDGQLSKMVTLTRLSIARCLYSLVSLPAEVVGRHRDTHVLPVLVQLLDDPIRVVRTEASKANNAWLAHI